MKFKKCCSANLPEAKSIGNDYLRCCKQEDFHSALRAARADVTQYTIWHQSHTATGLFAKTSVSVERIWTVDVEALYHYVGRLRRIYEHLGDTDDFLAVLERLRSNIHSEHWQQKIILLHTLCALGKEWDVEAGYREIIKLGPIDAVEDPMVLAVYLNISGDRLSFAERIKLIDRVRETSEDDSDIIHQGVVKATLLLMHNDPRSAGHTLGEVIEYCKKLDALDPYQRQKYGQALFIMSTILLDTKQPPERASQFLDQAVIEFTKYLEIKYLTDIGRAGGHRDLADVFCLKEDWRSAMNHYDSAIEISDDPILHVFRAMCLNGLEEVDEALIEIDALAIDSFDDDSEKADYILHFAILAVASGDKSRLQKAKKLLGLPLKREPVFQQEAMQMMNVVFEAIEIGGSSSLMHKARAILSKLSSSFILQPNFMGMGINLNKLIDEGVSKPDHSPKKE